jgi:hypothetical protein
MVGYIGPQARMFHVYSYVWNLGAFDLPTTKNANCVDYPYIFHTSRINV